MAKAKSDGSLIDTGDPGAKVIDGRLVRRVSTHDVIPLSADPDSQRSVKSPVPGPDAGREKRRFIATTSQALDDHGYPVGEPVAVGPRKSDDQQWYELFDGRNLMSVPPPAAGFPSPMFPFGEGTGDKAGWIWRTQAAHSITGGELMSYVSRHLAGDFGDDGKAADAVDTEASRWAPECFDRATRNMHAVRVGSGFIVSTYTVPRSQSFNSKAPGHGGPSGGLLHIVTYLKPGTSPVTVCVTSHDSPAMPE